MSRNEAFEAGKAAREAASQSYPTPYLHTTVPGDSRMSTHIMMGDQPSGVTSATVEGVPGLVSTVRMYKGKKNVGVMDSGDAVDHIQTHSDHQREGIATQMDRLANFAAGREGKGPIRHGDTRTPSGDAWAKKVGGETPTRIAAFGMRESRLKDLS